MKGLAGLFGDRPNACGVETYKFERVEAKRDIESPLFPESYLAFILWRQ